MLRTLDFKTGWQPERWPNFSIEELACRHCQAMYIWPEFLDRLQSARNDAAKPFRILSGHRCSLHNVRIGGAPLSQHLRLAVDISLVRHDRRHLLRVCSDAGFRGFGFYQTFLHIDLGRKRHWFGDRKAEKLWQTYLD